MWLASSYGRVSCLTALIGKMPLLILVIFVVMAYNTVPAASQCTDDCCYYYQFLPGDLTCNAQGRPSAVVLGCGILSPNGSDVTVRWYRSTQEHLARVQGELVTSGRNQDYIRNTQLPFKGLILSHHLRTIENFNENLNGFYWCQIEVNNTCLQPSPYGRIIFDSSSQRNCSSDNIVIHQPVPPLCANNSRTCPAIMTGTTMITLTPLGAPVGAPVGAVVVCTLLVVLLVVIILRLIRRKKEKNLATSEYKIQNTETSNELSGRNETELQASTHPQSPTPADNATDQDQYMSLNPTAMDHESIYTKSFSWSSTQCGRGRDAATGHYVEPMGLSSQCTTADHYVSIVVDDKKPTKSSDVYEHIQ